MRCYKVSPSASISSSSPTLLSPTPTPLRPNPSLILPPDHPHTFLRICDHTLPWTHPTALPPISLGIPGTPNSSTALVPVTLSYYPYPDMGPE